MWLHRLILSGGVKILNNLNESVEIVIDFDSKISKIDPCLGKISELTRVNNFRVNSVESID
jgi:hypothetical protein